MDLATWNRQFEELSKELNAAAAANVAARKAGKGNSEGDGGGKGKGYGGGGHKGYNGGMDDLDGDSYRESQKT